MTIFLFPFGELMGAVSQSMIHRQPVWTFYDWLALNVLCFFGNVQFILIHIGALVLLHM